MRHGLLALVLASCAGQVELAEWDPLDQAHVEQVLSSPTARRGMYRRWVEQGEDDVRALQDVGSLLEEVREVLGGGEASPDAPEPPSRGTQVYVQVACGGPRAGDPDADFAWGAVQIESATLSPQDLVDLQVRGHLLVTAIDCTHGSIALDGAVPSYYDLSEDTLAVDGRLEAVVDGGSQELDLLAAIHDTWRFRVAFADGTWAVLEIHPGSATLTVHLADGSRSCPVADPAACA